MLVIPGRPGKDLCDPHLGTSRRAVLRAGALGLFGVSLPSLLRLQTATANEATGAVKTAPGWNRAKSVVLVYLQGGPSHIDLFDPKENVPDNVRSTFKSISTKLPGVQFTDNIPKLAAINDRFTLIR